MVSISMKPITQYMYQLARDADVHSHVGDLLLLLSPVAWTTPRITRVSIYATIGYTFGGDYFDHDGDEDCFQRQVWMLIAFVFDLCRVA